MTRYLVTTADERSWKFDRPILFLGEWCRRYDRKHIWSEMDAVVAKPYGLEREQKLHDIDYVLNLTKQLLTELAEALNNFHDIQHSERYWNIVLGHWLQRYIAVAYNRYRTVDHVLRYHEVSGSTVLEFKAYSLTMSDSLAFIYACDNDQWNHVFFSKLLAFKGTLELNIIQSKQEEFNNEPKTEGSTESHGMDIKGILRKFVQAMGPKLAKSTDAFIINSYLPLKEEIKLQLALGQVPQLWRSPFFERHLPNEDFRSRLILDYDQHAGFERFVRQQISEVIPTCYLEGFKSLIQTMEALPWPKKPKFIFTSNNFAIDEVFKVWTGSKVEQGIPYFTGQHGNSYGAHIYFGNPVFPERSAADKFFTWGWTEKNSNATPAFNFKLSHMKVGGFKPEGGLLLIELHIPLRIIPWDGYLEYIVYQEEQFRFVKALPLAIQKKLTVRLHSAYNKLSWSDRKRWQDSSPQTHIAADTAHIKTLIDQSRLVVFSYDSSGILEALALNIPMICFWHGGLDHLLPQAKPYYELLRDTGILCDTPERAAEMVALNWNDVRGWWYNSEVQAAREAFCRQYSISELRPIRSLKKLLMQSTAEVVHGIS